MDSHVVTSRVYSSFHTIWKSRMRGNSNSGNGKRRARVRNGMKLLRQREKLQRMVERERKRLYLIIIFPPVKLSFKFYTFNNIYKTFLRSKKVQCFVEKVILISLFLPLIRFFYPSFTPSPFQSFIRILFLFYTGLTLLLCLFFLILTLILVPFCPVRTLPSNWPFYPVLVEFLYPPFTLY